jgi:hypothetical protein
MRMPRSWRAAAAGLFALATLAACVVGGYGDGGYVDEGYVGGVYEAGGYEYGGWGPGYRVGPPGGRRGPGRVGGRPPPSIPHGVRGGGPHGGGRPGH